VTQKRALRLAKEDRLDNNGHPLLDPNGNTDYILVFPPTLNLSIHSSKSRYTISKQDISELCHNGEYEWRNLGKAG
jgi:hypothetical protein